MITSCDQSVGVGQKRIDSGFDLLVKLLSYDGRAIMAGKLWAGTKKMVKEDWCWVHGMGDLKDLTMVDTTSVRPKGILPLFWIRLLILRISDRRLRKSHHVWLHIIVEALRPFEDKRKFKFISILARFPDAT